MAAGSAALVTNATEFAGPPAVDALVGAGFAVHCHDRSFADAETRAAFAAGRSNVRALEAQEPGAIVEEAIEGTDARALNVVVSNDSYPAILGPVDEADIEDLERTLEALVVMPFALMRAVVPHLKAGGGGSVIMITSPRAKLPMPGGSIPDAAREAGNALLRSFARELAPFDIPVNAIAPNYFANEMYFPHARFVDDPTGRAFVERMVPARRLGQPAELEELVTFLATTRARFMTGTTLEFTGGWPVAPTPPGQT